MIQVEIGFNLQAATCHILNFAQNQRQNQKGQRHRTTFGGVGTSHRKNIYTYFLDVGNNWGEEKTYTERGDTAQTLLMGVTITVGTPHNIERT